MGLEISPLHVRRSIFIEAIPSRVWKEFGSFDRLKIWFGRGHKLEKFEPKVGGAVRLKVEIGEESRSYGGNVLIFDAEKELSFSNNWDDPHDWPVPTFITIRLTAKYDGTLVELFHHGFERLGAAAADNLQGYEDGWTINHLQALRSLVDA